jgi:hypothetical protein
MSKLTAEDIAEFQRIAEQEGKTLTMDEAGVMATRLLFLYDHLAKPTPGEIASIARRERAERIVEIRQVPGSDLMVSFLKRRSYRGER